MSKYFYTDGVSKFGPFSTEELKLQNISRETKVWRYGMDTWEELSSLPELEIVMISIPPEIKRETTSESPVSIVVAQVKEAYKSPAKKVKKLPTQWIIGGLILVIASGIIFGIIKTQSKRNLYQEISANSFDSDENFEMYVDKFYRDLEYYGIYPKKPKLTIIKFSRLDQIDQTTHIHALTFGSNDDDRIEIYINPSTWKRFNKPMRYFLMYHELSHDLLNLDDLEATKLNEGKLMYPELSSYEGKNMDDFIESAHEVFEENKDGIK